MRLDDTTTPVTTVVTLAGHAFVALNLLAESVLSAGEDETHGEGVGVSLDAALDFVMRFVRVTNPGSGSKSVAAGSC